MLKLKLLTLLMLFLDLLLRAPATTLLVWEGEVNACVDDEAKRQIDATSFIIAMVAVDWLQLTVVLTSSNEGRKLVVSKIY